MSKANEPAHPVKVSHEHFQYPGTQYTGLTKRELFAAMAMQGICASPFENEADNPVRSDALMAVRIADALLAALEATP